MKTYSMWGESSFGLFTAVVVAKSPYAAFKVLKRFIGNRGLDLGYYNVSCYEDWKILEIPLTPQPGVENCVFSYNNYFY